MQNVYGMLSTSSLFVAYFMVSPAKRQYLLVKGTHGLGNRLLFLAHAVEYAKMTNRIIIIDWSDNNYSSGGKNIFSYLFDLKDVNYSLDLPSNYKSLSVYPKIWEGNLKKTFDEMKDTMYPNPKTRNRWAKAMKKMFCDMNNLNHEQDIIVMSAHNHKIANLLRKQKSIFCLSKKNEARIIVRFFFQKVLIPKKDIRGLVADFFNNAKPKPVIGIHIRHTAKSCFESNKWNFAIDALLRDVPDAKIFLATDSQYVEDQFQKIYTNKLLLVPRFYAPSNAEIHELNADFDTKYQHAKESIRDIYILSQCDHLLGQATKLGDSASFLPFKKKVHSTFSEMAMLISKKNIYFWPLLKRVILKPNGHLHLIKIDNYKPIVFL